MSAAKADRSRCRALPMPALMAALFAVLVFEALLFEAEGAWCAAAFPTHAEAADKEAGITTGARGAAKTTVPTASATELKEVTPDTARTNAARAFARHPDFVTARISPDGHYLAVTKYDEGFCALLVLDRATLAVTHMQKFNPPNEVHDFVWVKDHRLLISLATQVGSLDAPVLTGELWGVDADGQRGRMVYDWRREGGAPSATGPATLLDPLPRDPNNVVIVTYTGSKLGARRAVAQLLDVYTGHLKPLTTSPLADARLLTDGAGVVRLAVARNRNFELEIHARENVDAVWRRLFTLPFGSGDVLPIAFSADAREMFVLDSRATDTLGLFKLNLATGALQRVFVANNTDVEEVLLSVTDQQPYALRYGAQPQYAFLNDTAPESALLRIAVTAFPGKEVDLGSVTSDGKTAVVRVRGDRDPGTFYTVERGDPNPQLLLNGWPWLNAEQLARSTAVLIDAEDHQQLSGYLTAPPEGRPRPWPLVVLPHGGPHGPRARDRGLFDPLVQMLAQQGYAVLQVNYRGTAGFGQRFLRAGYGEWSGLIQRDIAAATRWAIASGAAARGRVCIMGESFGGFSALANAAQWPELYQCAIGAFGVYDLGVLRREGDTQRSIWGAAYLNAVVGKDSNVSLPNQAARIRAPVLLVHGALDQRAPVSQARAMRDALARIHHRVEYLEVPHAGHGFAAPKDFQRYYETVSDFLDRHIGAKRAL